MSYQNNSKKKPKREIFIEIEKEEDVNLAGSRESSKKSDATQNQLSPPYQVRPTPHFQFDRKLYSNNGIVNPDNINGDRRDTVSEFD